MKTKIKILHVIKSLGRGGAEMLLPETLNVHDRQLFEFHYIYFLPWKNQMVEAIEENGGTVTCFKANNNIQLLFQYTRVVAYCRKHKIDVIHAHLPWAGILARIVHKLANIPVIYTEHNKQERYHFLTRRVNLLTMNWQDTVIAVSNDVEGSIRRFKRSIKPHVETVVNGVNTVHFLPSKFGRDAIRQQYGIPLKSPVIGTIAVFRFQKRLDLWITIAKKIAASIDNVHFIIVGDGPLKNELIQKAKDEGIQDRLHFAGLQTEVRPYLAAFDIFMMTSVFEGLPIALLEAMSSGCAVISTTAGGIKEVIRDKVDGLLCDVDQPEELVGYALNILNSTALHKQLSENARQRIEASFSITVMTKRIEALYKELTM